MKKASCIAIHTEGYYQCGKKKTQNQRKYFYLYVYNQTHRKFSERIHTKLMVKMGQREVLLCFIICTFKWECISYTNIFLFSLKIKLSHPAQNSNSNWLPMGTIATQGHPHSSANRLRLPSLVCSGPTSHWQSQNSS